MRFTVEEKTADVNQRINAWLLEKYRRDDSRDERADPHLMACPETTLSHTEATDSMYGCSTGCDFVRMTAQVGCPHGVVDEWEYGDFGELADILDEIGELP